MFMLPNIHSLWTSEQTSLCFVELLGYDKNGRWAYLLCGLTEDGYVSDPISF